MQNRSVPFLRLGPIGQEIQIVLGDVFKKGVFMNGAYLESFKTEFSKYMGLKHIIPTANCTDALEIILRSHGIQSGDEVITNAFSWFSDASVIQLLGAEVVFCDIELNHFGIHFHSTVSFTPKNKKNRRQSPAVYLGKHVLQNCYYGIKTQHLVLVDGVTAVMDGYSFRDLEKVS